MTKISSGALDGEGVISSKAFSSSVGEIRMLGVKPRAFGSSFFVFANIGAFGRLMVLAWFIGNDWRAFFEFESGFDR